MLLENFDLHHSYHTLHSVFTAINADLHQSIARYYEGGCGWSKALPGGRADLIGQIEGLICTMVIEVVHIVIDQIPPATMLLCWRYLLSRGIRLLVNPPKGSRQAFKGMFWHACQSRELRCRLRTLHPYCCLASKGIAGQVWSPANRPSPRWQGKVEVITKRYCWLKIVSIHPS